MYFFILCISLSHFANFPSGISISFYCVRAFYVLGIMTHCLLFMVSQFLSSLCFSDFAFGSFRCINILNFYVIKPINLLLYVLFSLFLCLEMLPYCETDIYLKQHIKHCFTTAAIFIGSLLERCALWIRWEQKGGRGPRQEDVLRSRSCWNSNFWLGSEGFFSF